MHWNYFFYQSVLTLFRLGVKNGPIWARGRIDPTLQKKLVMFLAGFSIGTTYGSIIIIICVEKWARCAFKKKLESKSQNIASAYMDNVAEPRISTIIIVQIGNGYIEKK